MCIRIKTKVIDVEEIRKQNLENDLRKYEKNLETLACIKALKENKEVENAFTKEFILNKLLKLFEDDEVTLPFEGYIDEISVSMQKFARRLVKRYESIADLSYLLNDYRNTIQSNTTNNQYKLFYLFGFKESEWAIKFLTSDAPMNRKMELYERVLCDGYDFFYNNEMTKEEKEKINELNNYIQNNTEEKRKIYKLLMKSYPARLVYFQKNKILDFSGINIYGRNSSVQSILLEYITISKNVSMRNENRFNLCYYFLQGENYSKYYEKYRNRDMIILLKECFVYKFPERIAQLVQLDFNLTKTFINTLSSVVVAKTRKELKDEDYQALRNGIADIIEKKALKAKSKEEFDKIMGFKQYFLDNTNIEMLRLERKKKKLEKQKHELELLNARMELTKVLSNVNEQVKEGNYHFNKKVKNIDFKN